MEFWDKNITQEQLKSVLKDETHLRFIEWAALFLSRTNDTREVFSRYLDKKVFCRNWNAIKKKMRKNKWNDARIVFWNAFYKVLSKKFDKKEIRPPVRKTAQPIAEVEKIGILIREARERQGWTQKDLSQKTRLSQQTISLVERGFINASFLSLKKIGDVLGLEISVIDKHKIQRTNQPYTTTFTSLPQAGA